ncbi:MAG: DNA-binding response regulator, partial [Saprospiraceae bacterium]|nr:DNA-binding response regulator [Saprospiraceae bacterium]
MAKRSLEKLCEKYDHIELLNCCENAENALAFLENTDVDLLFLDIEMP